MAATLSDPLTGRLLDGRYEIGRLIARGGMAAVYEAMDTRLERTVAVKVMHPSLAADPEFVARFIREARSAARLSHANVVAVYDQGTDGEVVYLAMEYVDGATLRDLLRMRGRLAVPDALVILEQVLGALAAAHKAGLVHRDVKPENVLLTEDGRVKVADFGLARAVTSSVGSSPLTTGVIIGTVSYLAPEQVERSIADARSDVYAAGIMLFEMITGEKPYTGATPMEVAFRHVHERVPAPSTRVPGIAPDVDTLVLRSTARNPDDRPHDAAELRAEVVRARDGRPVLLRPPPDDVERTVRLEPTAPVVRPGDTLVVARTVEPALPTISRRSETAVDPASNRDPMAARRRRRRGWVLFLVVVLLGAAIATGAWWFAEGRFTTAPLIPPGTSETSAAAALDQAGLDATFVDAFSEEVPAGLVVSTDPAGGARVLSGEQVTVHLSKGPERFQVPDVAELTEAAAIARIQELPLVVGETVLEYSETVPDGAVIRTEPTVLEEVKRDTEITIYVSQGREAFPIPSVEGETLADAIAILEREGFVAIEDPAVFHDTVPEGVVISQSPKDASGFRESGVHLVVSKGPEFIEVPSVIGDTAAEAEAELTAAGFDVDIQFVLPEALTDDLVIRQSPNGLQRPGTTITIYII